MSDNERFGPGAYLTPEEAREFHKMFVVSFIGFTILAIVAHALVWNWRPWGFAGLDETAQAMTIITSLLA
jgi:light-harvesting complex 1 beta chain